MAGLLVLSWNILANPFLAIESERLKDLPLSELQYHSGRIEDNTILLPGPGNFLGNEAIRLRIDGVDFPFRFTSWDPRYYEVKAAMTRAYQDQSMIEIWVQENFIQILQLRVDGVTVLSYSEMVDRDTSFAYIPLGLIAGILIVGAVVVRISPTLSKVADLNTNR